MAVGAPTSLAAEATGLLAPDQIIAASKAPPSVIADMVLGREIGSTIGGRIHLPTVSNFMPYRSPLALTPAAELWLTTYY